MSTFKDNINKRAVQLGMEVKDVHAELNRRGIPVSYSTVAGWFNNTRGRRWNVEQLHALLDVLQTDLAAMAGTAALVEKPIPAETARRMERLPLETQQAILAMVASLESKLKPEP